MIKYTKEIFINQSNKIHHNKYDYNKVEYVNKRTKVCIICPEHGEFWQLAGSHLQGHGCPKCGRIEAIKQITLTHKEFIEKSRQIHGDKYDYSKVEYINNSTKVCIICPEHGEFWQTPNDHLSKHGCPECVGLKKSNTQKFIEKAKKIYNDKYEYSKVNYINNHTKVCIICPEHGEFWKTPNTHLNGQGCAKCNGRYNYSTQDFIKESKQIHGDRYDYSKVNYTNNSTKVCIICPEHGEFWQLAGSHLQGHGCPKCGLKSRINKRTLSNENFILKSNKIHHNKYDYSKSDYKGNKFEVIITCPKHGEFKQIANYHLQGCGCPKCALENNIYEDKLYSMLIEALNTDIIRQKNFKWLKYKNFLSLDFYIPIFNVAIEYQGEQHFKPIEHFGGEEKFITNKLRDKIKIDKCKEHNVKLLHFTFNKNSIPENFNEYKIITDINELIKIIQNGKP